MTRADRVEELLAERELDSLLVTNLVNVRYLTGYTGTNGACVVGGGRRVFLTDFRYMTQAGREVEGFDVEQGRQDLLEDAAAHLAGRVGFEDFTMTVRQLERLRGFAGDETELLPAGRLVEGVRTVKEDGELASIRAAAALADEVLSGLAERGLAGRTERDVAVALEHRMRELGAEGPSFASIVASGERSALPHAVPADVPIAPDALVTLDIGARVDGYCSDCTRTWATGSLPEPLVEAYGLVRRAQAEALAAVRPGLEGRTVDAVAREIIDGAGHGEHFGHGLGHGVGLDVHEGPRLARTSETALTAGNVVTVEPGVYLPGLGGVRIEDLVVVAEDGPEVLSGTAKDLQTVA